MTQRGELARWVGAQILPHERDVRLWLQRRLVAEGDVEDIVQECYCQFAQLSEFSHIAEPRAYFFTTARHLAFRQLRRAAVVRMEAISDTIRDELQNDQPSPEQAAVAREELGRVEEALKTLSARARRIFIMRRVDGLSQKEIARQLGVSEMVVENEASRSLRAVLKLLTDPAKPTMASPTKGVSRVGKR
ncbi:MULTISPECIES: RNA polymerase sigma factor [unclassified Azospirillum]|uniref:RNA polymerase sigma factor n=1 Tax=unclassified Azospirillum TaxID=2630922 RepID=UPI000B755E80|nr:MULTISPECIES: sigma-70 family RNA polymerase sigma factor [unclassified Azospirillum]SNS67086.1 RNA polymerase sigma-70 factor, ECF subfamily [Azospirillum sp. RU38E]SNS85325.1 RNA polymerase sigma-70 factor, ECF subfamily [Azospirillum sp. RU37A]